jgi:hypothetical protein
VAVDEEQPVAAQPTQSKRRAEEDAAITAQHDGKQSLLYQRYYCIGQRP